MTVELAQYYFTIVQKHCENLLHLLEIKTNFINEKIIGSKTSACSLFTIGVFCYYIKILKVSTRKRRCGL